MCQLRNVFCLLVLFCECILHVKSIPCRGSARYKLQFQAEWENTTDRPADAGFSGLIGCSHNKCYQMWRPGEKASLGVKNVAEKGDTQELKDEINNLVKNRTTTAAFTKPGPLGPKMTSNVGFFNVNSVRPLVSVIGKITPSPDWFIGVHDLDLCDRKTGTWVKSKQVKPVYPYDAGTNSGSQFTFSNGPSSPQGYIARIHGGALKTWTEQERELGVFNFNRESFSGHTTTGEFASDENFKCPNIASQKHVSYVIMVLTVLLVLLNFQM